MSREDESGRDTVVLVHGIWLKGLEWLPLKRRLRRRGYRCVVFRYSSVREPPVVNAARLASFMRRLSASRVHLVAHSLGGIVAMHLFAGGEPLPPGRVVFIGTPAQGSAAARRLARWPVVGSLLGMSRQQGLLGGAPGWSCDRELGVIAGDLPLGAGLLLGGLPRPHDGTVALAETEVSGATDRKVLHGSHLGLLWLAETAELVDRFLRSGRFDTHSGA